MRPASSRPFPLLTLSLTLAWCPAHAQENPEKQKPEAAKSDAAAKAAKPRVPFLRPSGSYEDLAEMGFSPLSLLGDGGAMPKPFFRFLESVDALAKVPEPLVVLDLSGKAQFNLPQLRELERAVARVRAAGKQITCYVENADTGSYQLAALCDQVLMADMGLGDYCHHVERFEVASLIEQFTAIAARRAEFGDALRARNELFARQLDDQERFLARTLLGA